MINQSVASPKMGIIISMFPELHETFILRELVALERRGLEFEIFSLQYPRDPITIDDAIRLSEERTHYAALFGAKAMLAFVKALGKNPLKVLSSMAKLCWIGRDRPKDVVKNLAILPLTLHVHEIGEKSGVTHWHGHWANIPTTACWFLQQIKGETWSAAIHGEDIFSPNRFLKHKLDDAEFAVVCSGYFCNHLQTEIGLKSPNDVHLNYHGLDPRVMERSETRQFNQRDKNVPLKLVSIGRLVPTKGHDVLIKACAQLRSLHGIEFNLQLIGSGPIENELKALAESEGVADAIEFRGGLAFEEVLETLERSDVFCLAPRLMPGHPPDGIPNVIAEAMALRIPVVSTRVSAIPELISNGETGQLVEVGDVDAFAQAIAELGSDSEKAQAISDKGFDKVGQLFDQQANISELIELFQRYVPERAVP